MHPSTLPLGPTKNNNTLRPRCSNAAPPLRERLAALKRFQASEVGDTALFRARALERRYGLRQLYLKVEGDNPTGSHKDRIAVAQVYDALRRGFEVVCFATCGNYGVAMANAAKVANVSAVAVVPETYRASRVRQIESLRATVLRAGEHYEAAVEQAQALAARNHWYDANPGGSNEALQVQAYREIAFEIADRLGEAPAAVALPVSNGTTLGSVYRGFVSLKRRGRTSRLPALLAGSAFRKNPIVRAWQAGLPRCEDLDPACIRMTSINAPLVNWHAIDGRLALDAVRVSGGFAAGVSDRRLKALSLELRKEQGLLVLPASTAGLAALLTYHERGSLPEDRYVAVLTARIV